MPKILEEDIDKNYCEKYLLTAIMPDGSIIATKKGNNHGFHKDAFSKLITEMEKVLERKMMLEPKEGLYDNLEEFINKNIIPISTLYIEQTPYKLSNDVQVLKFPRNMKESQISSMNKLSVIFEDIGCVYFNEQGKDDSEEHKGVDELKEYLENKMREIEEINER